MLISYNLRLLLPSTSALVDNVTHVIGMGTQPKMAWINASWIVTARAIVANLEAVRDRPVMQFVRYSMSVLHAIGVQLAIAALRLCPLPNPASIWFAFRDFFPKAIFEGSKVVMPANVSHRHALNVPFVDACNRGDGCGLTASAHAESARVRRGQPIASAVSVPCDKSHRQSFEHPLAGMCSRGKIGALSATALAHTVWRNQAMLGNPGCVIIEIVREMGRGGMIGHVVSPPETIGHATGCFQQRRGAFIGRYRSNCSTEAQKGERSGY